jgi:hypothetical protein
MSYDLCLVNKILHMIYFDDDVAYTLVCWMDQLVTSGD